MRELCALIFGILCAAAKYAVVLLEYSCTFVPNAARHSCRRAASYGRASTYQASCCLSRKKPPVGPSSANMAAHTIPAAPSATGRAPISSPPGNVAVNPGRTAFTRISDSRSSSAKVTVRHVERGLRDAVARPHIVGRGQPKLLVAVRTPAARHIHDPAPPALAQERQKRLAGSPCSEEIDVHHLAGAQ